VILLKRKACPPWREKLGWEAKIRFEELIKIMVKDDLEKVIKRGF